MEWLTVVAIIIGPILAVQTQKFIERRGAERQRKLQIFKSLMATRGAVLSPVHVEALNLIDVEFSQKKSGDKRVLNSWALYRDHLTGGVDEGRAAEWNEKAREYLTRLLYEMGQSLGYGFDEVHIKRGAYVPQAHGFMEEEQNFIRREFVRILKGEAAFPMKVTDFPNVFDEDYTDAAVKEALSRVLAEKDRPAALPPPADPNQ